MSIPPPRRRHPVRSVSTAALALSTLGALALVLPTSPATAAAAAGPLPLDPATTTSVSGEILHVDALDLGGLLTAAEVGLGPVSGGLSAASPRARASASNLDASLLGLGVPSLLSTSSQTAPPDNTSPDVDSIIPSGTAPGVLGLGVSNTMAQARLGGTAAAATCLPGVPSPARSSVETASASLVDVPGVGPLVALPGTVSLGQETRLVANGLPDGGRDVVADTLGSAADLQLLGGQVRVRVASAPRLTATATGRPGGARVDYDRPVVEIGLAGQQLQPLTAATPFSQAADGNPLLQLRVSLGTATETESADGRAASGEATLLRVQLALLPVLGGNGVTVADLGLFPMTATATAPAGGVTCGTVDPAADTDKDGLTDVQETTLTGTDPTKADTDGDGTSDAAEDPDDDGLTNLQEVTGSANTAFGKQPTDPRKADTDGGGADDGIETAAGTDPNLAADDTTGPLLDTDKDGLSDVQELTLTGTDPTKADTDGDGTSDAAEDPDDDGLTNLQEVTGSRNTAFGKRPTDPRKADTDGGGVNDGAETTAGTDPRNGADDKVGPVVDTDKDGLTDVQETTLTGTDPTKADTDGDGTSDADEDPDGDGLTNLQEVTGSRNTAFGNQPTDPRKADTDGGGVNDGAETTVRTDPNRAADDRAVVDPGTDTDGDGLTDVEEIALGTDPTKADTDGDGLTDGREVDTTRTDPRKADTDGDTLTDGREVTSTRTSPVNPDTDGDTLTDGREVNGIRIAQKVRTNKVKQGRVIGLVRTNPLRKDTDADGLADNQEVNGVRVKSTIVVNQKGKKEALGVIRSNPLRKDTDADGVKDKAEVTGSANKRFGKRATSPADWDTDRGGFSDGKEIKAGSDPSNYKSGPRNPRG